MRISYVLGIARMSLQRWVGAAILLAMAALLMSASAYPADYGEEHDDAGCTVVTDIAQYYGCLDKARDAELQKLAAVTAGVISVANSAHLPRDFAPDIQRSQENWLKWMDSECTLEGLLDDGSAAPTPWLQRCELRMMKQRAKTMAAIQKVLLNLSAPPKARKSAAEPLLSQLRAELAQARSGPENQSLDVQRPDLALLVGSRRDRIASALGPPDYCKARSVAACSRAAHWTYFFYHFQPTYREASGETYISLHLQGWAVELQFTQAGAVKSAAWVRQE